MARGCVDFRQDRNVIVFIVVFFVFISGGEAGKANGRDGDWGNRKGVGGGSQGVGGVGGGSVFYGSGDFVVDLKYANRDS